MKIINYLYVKYLFSFLISISASLAIFFIFSLIGSLDEKINFKIIIYLSFLNSIQILNFVNSFVIFVSFVFFVIILKGKNEIIIIKEYLSSKKIIIIFLPVIFVCAFLEIEKGNIAKQINHYKSYILESSQTNENKIIIDTLNDYKEFTVIKGIDLKKSKIKEILKYKIIKDEIAEAEYSNDLIVSNDEIISNKLTKFNLEKIIIINKPSKILENFKKYNNKQIVFYENQKNNLLNLNFNLFNSLFYNSLFYLSLILIIMNRQAINKKNNFIKNVSIGIFLLLYSISVNSIVLSNFNFEMNMLSLLFIILIFIKYFKYE
jgi:hypothetical protein